MIVFLASDDASSCTGIDFLVDDDHSGTRVSSLRVSEMASNAARRRGAWGMVSDSDPAIDEPLQAGRETMR